jgi:hypothetical protein
VSSQKLDRGLVGARSQSQAIGKTFICFVSTVLSRVTESSFWASHSSWSQSVKRKQIKDISVLLNVLKCNQTDTEKLVSALLRIIVLVQKLALCVRCIGQSWPCIAASAGCCCRCDFHHICNAVLLYKTYLFWFLFSLCTGCFILKEQTVFHIPMEKENFGTIDQNCPPPPDIVCVTIFTSKLSIQCFYFPCAYATVWNVYKLLVGKP